MMEFFSVYIFVMQLKYIAHSFCLSSFWFSWNTRCAWCNQQPENMWENYRFIRVVKIPISIIIIIPITHSTLAPKRFHWETLTLGAEYLLWSNACHSVKKQWKNSTFSWFSEKYKNSPFLWIQKKIVGKFWILSWLGNAFDVVFLFFC